MKAINVKDVKKKKNIVIIAKTGHNYEDKIVEEATCTEEGTSAQICKICNDKTDEQKVGANGHSYVTIIKEATCTENGLRVQKCQICNEEKAGSDETIESFEHNYGDWTTIAATCSVNGSRTRTCSKCSNTESETIVAFGHNYGEWSTKTEATCTEAKVEKRICTVCNNEETQSSGSALGHDWKISATLLAVTWWKCDDCGEKSTEPFMFRP